MMFGDVRVIIQEDGFSCVECFMCCAHRETVFLPKLNEPINIVCPTCANGMLKFGVLYKSFPIFRSDSKELFICTNCNYVYSPIQIESILFNQSRTTNFT